MFASVPLLVGELLEIDRQISEKIKPLRTYKLQEKNLELSVNEVFKSLKTSIEDVKEKSDRRLKMKEDINKTREDIKSLEVLLQMVAPLEIDQGLEFTIGEPEPALQQHDTKALNVQKPQEASQYKAILSILEEKMNHSRQLENNVTSLNREIKQLTKEITEQRDSLIKEHQLLLSKSQQIHQLQGVTGMLETKANALGMRVDQQLQQEYAATSMFKSSVFQVI